MQIIHPQAVRKALPTKQADVYALALSLSRLHPHGLEPAVAVNLSPSGRQMTYLSWYDVSIRIFFSDNTKKALAMGISRTRRNTISQQSIFYTMGEFLDPALISQVFNPTRHDPPPYR